MIHILHHLASTDLDGLANGACFLVVVCVIIFGVIILTGANGGNDDPHS